MLRTVSLLLAVCCLVACSRKSASSAPESKSPSKQIKQAVARMADGDPLLPGVNEDSALTQKLRSAIGNHGNGYKPRTHHFNEDGAPTYVNRLILETSPYLLQHAHNPVNWFPWGDAAFARARKSGKPVFMSVGYSTCHWCHVMEKESFEDVEIAKFINENFIAIKVDREERPDVDSIYMSAVHMMVGRGGWPMTVMMTPDGEPFFTGTYFPARDGDRGSRKGFLTILGELSERYKTDKAGVVAKAREISGRIQQMAKPRPGGSVPSAHAIQKTAESYSRRFDAQWGGFGRRPKFPRPSSLDFLLRYHRRTQDARALHMVKLTLQRMARGGMYDLVGGGFHRYSVDTRWLVPHFEKMLYDNGQLVSIYLDAFQVTREPRFEQVSREVLDYVIREMTSQQGGYYSATDADSMGPSGHREEGYFFTWTPSELSQLVGADGLQLLRKVYGVTDRGNFEGRNIFYRVQTTEKMALTMGMTAEGLKTRLDAIEATLYKARSKRPTPLLDDKVLASWNGLMMSAFARAGRVLGEKRYIESARRSARFILTQMSDKSGRLHRTWRQGEARLNAYLDDYAFVIAGLLELFEATAEKEWFAAAVRLQRFQDKHYLDRQHGGYFSTSDDHEQLMIRDKPDYDGAEPSGNSISAMNLLRLYAFTGDVQYQGQADGIFAAFSNNLKRGSTGMPAMLSALEMRLDETRQVVVVRAEDDDSEKLEAVLKQVYLPNRAIALLDEAQTLELSKVMPIVAGKTPQRNLTTAYVCVEGRCEQPATTPERLAEQLGSIEPLFSDRSAPPLQ